MMPGIFRLNRKQVSPVRPFQPVRSYVSSVFVVPPRFDILPPGFSTFILSAGVNRLPGVPFFDLVSLLNVQLSPFGLIQGCQRPSGRVFFVLFIFPHSDFQE